MGVQTPTVRGGGVDSNSLETRRLVRVDVAVQNERDRISVRRPSCDDLAYVTALSVTTLHNAELLSRQVTQQRLLYDFLCTQCLPVCDHGSTMHYDDTV